MKKLTRILFLVLTALLLLLLAYVAITFPPVMRGMGAKVMCSCVFLTGRSPESVVNKELQVFPGLADIPYDINYNDSTVTARFLWGTSTAIYRKGLGCTLLAQADEEAVRSQRFVLPDPVLSEADRLPWPSGDLDAYDTTGNIDHAAISTVIRRAFEERQPDKPANTHAVIVVYDGKIVGEEYAAGFGKESMLMGWSMTKSVTNALIGILVKEGKLNVDAPAPVAEWENDERRAITLTHLLRASSGLAWSESYFLPGADFHNMFIHSDDKAAYAIDRPLEYEPGTHFEYSSGTTNILSAIIRRTVGEERYHRFPYESLFRKIGMRHAMLEPDASGTFVASSYGYASARDWARLGLLYLNDGVWNGERILPEGWVAWSTTPAPAAPRREYGAQIWLNLGAPDDPTAVKFPGLPHEAIVFSGFEQNFVVIIPSKKLVVVRLGVTHHDSFSIGALVAGVLQHLPDSDTPAYASLWGRSVSAQYGVAEYAPKN